MKIIQDRELDRICTMIRSSDREMNELACAILCKKQSIRFSLSTIVAFHFFLFLISLVGTFLLTVHTPRVLDYILFLTVISQAIFSIYYIRVICDFRIAYNNSIKDLFG